MQTKTTAFPVKGFNNWRQKGKKTLMTTGLWRQSEGESDSLLNRINIWRKKKAALETRRGKVEGGQEKHDKKMIRRRFLRMKNVLQGWTTKAWPRNVESSSRSWFWISFVSEGTFLAIPFSFLKHSFFPFVVLSPWSWFPRFFWTWIPFPAFEARLKPWFSLTLFSKSWQLFLHFYSHRRRKLTVKERKKRSLPSFIHSHSFLLLLWESLPFTWFLPSLLREDLLLFLHYCYLNQYQSSLCLLHFSTLFLVSWKESQVLVTPSLSVRGTTN
jgi:hypothetical protein